MNVICDSTQFVIVVLVPNEIVATLAKYFMQHVLLKFDICYLIILDDGSPFKGIFTAMCKTLNTNFDILAKRNHKFLLVEKFYRFVNSITIAAEDRRTNDVFIAVGYVWNSLPIDGTDIPRSVPVIGQELRFSLDIDLITLLPFFLTILNQLSLTYF